MLHEERVLKGKLVQSLLHNPQVAITQNKIWTRGRGEGGLGLSDDSIVDTKALTQLSGLIIILILPRTTVGGGGGGGGGMV